MPRGSLPLYVEGGMVTIPFSRKGLMAARTVLLAFLACVTLAACSQNSRGQPRQNMSLITREQIDANHFLNAYDAIQATRSNWLQTRGTDSFATPSEVIVYRDNVKVGGIEELRSIKATTIAFIRYYDGMEATSRWGVGHSVGVIQVSSFTENRN
jgi:hypothetical protein